MHSFLKTGKLSKEDARPSSSSGSGQSSSSKSKPTNRPTPWVEKYRPRTVDDVVEQKEIVSVLKQCLEGADLPHLLFYGPPGTGKTSTIIAASRQLFGDIYKERILELNASDDRGIQVIRDKVKQFAQLSVSSHTIHGDPCPPFKIVILDEADSMTHAAQAALRRTMEKESKTTRFCLICNYVSCIIPPLTSRCTKFRFKPLGEGMVLTRLEMICKQENVACDSIALKTLVETSGGDLRRAITCLQSCARLKGGDPVTQQDVLEVTGVVRDQWLSKIIDACASNDFDLINSTVEDFILDGYPVAQLFEQLLDHVWQSLKIHDHVKSVICEELSLADWRLQDGACEFVQLYDLCSTMATALQEVAE